MAPADLLIMGRNLNPTANDSMRSTKPDAFKAAVRESPLLSEAALEKLFGPSPREEF